MKKIFSILVDAWQPIIFAAIALCLCVFVYSFRLGSLTNGYSGAEITAVSATASGRQLLQNPINLPHKVGQYILWKTNHTSTTAMRSVSVILAVVSIALFYYIVSRWHTARIASLTTLVFAASSWMLHVGRSATPDILHILLPLALIATGIFIRESPREKLALHIGAFVAAVSLYIPFGFVYVIPVLLWRSRSFFTNKDTSTWVYQLTSILLFFVVSAPLLYILVRTPDLVSNLLLIPNSSTNLGTIWQTAASAAVSLVAGAIDLTPDIWLNQIPILDVASTVLLLLGIYTYVSWIRLQRSKLFFTILIVGLFFIGLSASVSTISVIMPVIYLLIGGGITYLLKEWFFVFPRNPIARNLGGSLVSILVLLITFYHINHYFIAWPLSQNTRSAFTSVDLLQ